MKWFVRVFLTLCCLAALYACGDDSESEFVSPKGEDVISDDKSSSFDDEDSSSDSKNGSSTTSSSSGNEDDGVTVPDSSSSSSSWIVDYSSDYIYIRTEPYYNWNIKFLTYEDSRDSSTYHAIPYGSYIWLVDNLWYSSSNSRDYEGHEDSYKALGKYYSFEDKSCPEGFVVAPYEAWMELLDSIKVVRNLRGSFYWNTTSVIQKGTDLIGFNMVPSGFCTDSACSKLGEEARFVVNSGAKKGILVFTLDTFELKEYSSDMGMNSIRCVKPQFVATYQDLPRTCFETELMTVTDTQERFICKEGYWWKYVSSVPSACTKEQELDTLYNGKSVYVCKSEKWFEKTALEIGMGLCTAKNNKDTLTFHNINYTCQDLAWIETPMSVFLGSCSADNAEQIKKYKSKDYLCKNEMWIERCGSCIDDLEGEICLNKVFNYYTTCHGGTWKRTVVEDYDVPCTKERQDSVIVGLHRLKYACQDLQWRELDQTEMTYGLCTEKIQDSIVYSKKIICDKRQWRTTTINEQLSSCTESATDSVYYFEGTPYICYDKTWHEGSKAYVCDVCTSKMEGQRCSNSVYFCHNRQWHYLQGLSLNLGSVCDAYTDKDSIFHYKDTSYACRYDGEKYDWAKISMDEEFPCNEKHWGEVKKEMVCDSSYKGFGWRETHYMETILDRYCISKDLYAMAEQDGKYYQCLGIWRPISQELYEMPECTEDLYDHISMVNDTLHYCSSEYNAWVMNSYTSYVAGVEPSIPCNKDSNMGTYKQDGILYVCIGKDEKYITYEEAKKLYYVEH